MHGCLRMLFVRMYPGKCYHYGFSGRQEPESRNCTELLGVDISQPEAFARAQAEDTFAGTCPDSVRAAAEILVDML